DDRLQCLDFRSGRDPEVPDDPFEGVAASAVGELSDASVLEEDLRDGGGRGGGEKRGGGECGRECGESGTRSESSHVALLSAASGRGSSGGRPRRVVSAGGNSLSGGSGRGSRRARHGPEGGVGRGEEQPGGGAGR